MFWFLLYLYRNLVEVKKFSSAQNKAQKSAHIIIYSKSVISQQVFCLLSFLQNTKDADSDSTMNGADNTEAVPSDETAKSSEKKDSIKPRKEKEKPRLVIVTLYVRKIKFLCHFSLQVKF